MNILKFERKDRGQCSFKKSFYITLSIKFIVFEGKIICFKDVRKFGVWFIWPG